MEENVKDTEQKRPGDAGVQAGAILQAMSVAWAMTAQSFEKPDPMAMAAALAHMKAQFLATIPDRRLRKQIRKEMDTTTLERTEKMLAVQRAGR